MPHNDKQLPPQYDNKYRYTAVNNCNN